MVKYLEHVGNTIKYKRVICLQFFLQQHIHRMSKFDKHTFFLCVEKRPCGEWGRDVTTFHQNTHTHTHTRLIKKYALVRKNEAPLRVMEQ